MSTFPKQQLNLSEGFGALLVTSPNITVELTDDGRVVVNKGTVEQPDLSAKVEFKKVLKTGDVIDGGPNKGWIFCEGEGFEPFLVASGDDKLRTWSSATHFADEQNMQLPTKEQLQAIHNARNKGALKNTFDMSGSRPSGWYWSSSVYQELAWCRNFSDGRQFYDFKSMLASVRYVRPYTPA